VQVEPLDIGHEIIQKEGGEQYQRQQKASLHSERLKIESSFVGCGSPGIWLTRR
jgi:hypothetical protein